MQTANYFQQGMHAMSRSLFVASSAIPAGEQLSAAPVAALLPAVAPEEVETTTDVVDLSSSFCKWCGETHMRCCCND